MIQNKATLDLRSSRGRHKGILGEPMPATLMGEHNHIQNHSTRQDAPFARFTRRAVMHGAEDEEKGVCTWRQLTKGLNQKQHISNPPKSALLPRSRQEGPLAALVLTGSTLQLSSVTPLKFKTYTSE